MDEFQAYSELNDLEALKEVIPSFAKAQLEPFLVSAQQDVIAPTWNKIQLSVSDTPFNTIQSGSASLIRCVIGVQENGSFVPKLAFVTGPAEDIP